MGRDELWVSLWGFGFVFGSNPMNTAKVLKRGLRYRGLSKTALQYFGGIWRFQFRVCVDTCVSVYRLLSNGRDGMQFTFINVFFSINVSVMIHLHIFFTIIS